MEQTKTIQIQLLLAENKTAEALDQLLDTELSNDWKETILLLKANLLNIDQQLIQGVISHEKAQLQYNRINLGTLKALTYIGTGTGDAETILTAFKNEFPAKNKTENTTNISNSTIDIKNSEGVVIGSGNKITQQIFKALGQKQFWTILAGLIAIIAIGTAGGRLLFSQQKGNFHSLKEIKKELTVLADLNINVKAQLEKNGDTLNDWLAKGMQAMEEEDYVVAIQYLEKVAEEVPLATVRQNLSVAYEKLQNAEKRKTNLAEAKKINPNIKLPGNYSSLKGKRINLLLPENGGELIVAAKENLRIMTDGEEADPVSFHDGHEAVYGFLDERPASFDMFSTLIKNTDRHNLKDFVLLYGNDSPTGNFTVIDTFRTENKRLNRTPYQEFSFKKTTAKYFKIRPISSYGNVFGYSNIPEIRLYGTLK
ncbi:MAG: hypothetical protein AAFZ15_13420 [Bacteroidota bacterium]